MALIQCTAFLFLAPLALQAQISDEPEIPDYFVVEVDSFDGSQTITHKGFSEPTQFTDDEGYSVWLFTVAIAYDPLEKKAAVGGSAAHSGTESHDIYLKRVRIKTGDGQITTIESNFRNSDVTFRVDGSIYAIAFTVAEIIDVMKKIASSTGEIIVRYEGDGGHVDIVLPQEHVRAWKQTYEFWKSIPHE